MKSCSKCKQVKSLDCYNKDKHRKDGLYPLCKKCRIPYRDSQSSKHKVYMRFYYEKNKEHILAQQKQKYNRDSSKVLMRNKAYREKYKKLLNETRRLKLKTNIQFSLAHSLRRRMNNALRIKDKTKKLGTMLEFLGCSLEEFVTHIESLFQPGMTWENRGKVWHIDHIMPLSKSDLTDRGALIKVCNYKNLRPLYALDNLRKGAK